MAQIEDANLIPRETAALSLRRMFHGIPGRLTWQAAMAAGALAVAAGGLGLAYRRRALTALPRGADKTMGAASPAVLGTTPRRRFYTGRDLPRAVTIEDLRAMAHRRLPRFALEYLEGGAEDEATLAHNIAVWTEWRFAPRALVEVARRDLSTELFGRPMAMPLVIAPTGLNELFWPHADRHLAEAAAAAGIPFAQSTMSNDPMAEVARLPGLRHWWQLYVFGRQEIRDRLTDRARDAGCEALIVTTDAQTYGNREWETRNNADSENLSWNAKLETLLHPGWLAAGLLMHGMPRFANVIDFVPRDRRRFFDSAMWIRSRMDRALSWETVDRIRERWPRRLIIKGLLDVDDVVRAATIGADAVALSNHGGRQLDWAVAPLDVLPEARRAVGNRLAIFVDGGIRRGSDVIKALALGADAVLIGRAALYGVAAAGRPGAARALAILREEIDRDLALLGCPSVKELGPRFLVRSP
jgi:(S)-mandelate dehydrogenase